MKKLLFAFILIYSVGCTSTEKLKEKIYKKENVNIEKYFNQYKDGKISYRELQTLVLGSVEYVEYFVAPIKKRKQLK